MKIVRIVLLAIAAVMLTVANFFVDLAGAPKGGDPSAAVSGALGFIAAPFVIAAICLAWKKYRNPASFLVVVCAMSGLMLLSGLGKLPTMKERQQIQEGSSGVTGN